LDSLSERCLLADEAVQALETDRTLSTELRREAIQLAAKRGNASYVDLIDAAWKIGIASDLPNQEYKQAFRRAEVAVNITPGHGRSWEFNKALLSTQRAMEIQKSQGPDAHAIRAMAYYRLHDIARAQSEAAMGRKAADQSKVNEDHKLLEEAESLIGAGKADLVH
jgi:hypothetical protein